MIRAFAFVVVALISFNLAGQSLKITDAVLRANDGLLHHGSGSFSYAYRVETYNPNKTKLRVYRFDSIPRLQRTSELDLYGDYVLAAVTTNDKYISSVALSDARDRLAFWFINNETGAAESPVLLSVPPKPQYRYRYISSSTGEYFLLVMTPLKGKAPLRVLAVSPTRILWDMSIPAGEYEWAGVWASDNKFFVGTQQKGFTKSLSVFSQEDGKLLKEFDLSQEPLVLEDIYTIEDRIILGSRLPDKKSAASGGNTRLTTISGEDFSPIARHEWKPLDENAVVWVDMITVNSQSYLVGEEFFSDTGPGAAVGALATLVGVYGANFTILTFKRVVIQPFTPSDQAMQAPVIVDVKKRSITVPGLWKGTEMAAIALARGRQRYIETTSNGMLKFLAGEEVVDVSPSNGQINLVGTFDYKGKVPPVIDANSRGVILRETDPNTSITNFQFIPFK